MQSVLQMKTERDKLLVQLVSTEKSLCVLQLTEPFRSLTLADTVHWKSGETTASQKLTEHYH